MSRNVVVHCTVFYAFNPGMLIIYSGRWVIQLEDGLSNKPGISLLVF